METLKVAVNSGQNDARKSSLEPPFDVMCGFRGAHVLVDLLPPFDMLRYLRMKKVLPPKRVDKDPTAMWTAEGEKNKSLCVGPKETKAWEAGKNLPCARK